MAESKGAEDIRCTVFIKVPFPRGDFEDPPDSNWNAAKDGALWKILSSTAKGTEIDWEHLYGNTGHEDSTETNLSRSAQRFNVTLNFLLQQAAWLYERQLSQVREQLRRVSKPGTGSSPTPLSAGGTPGSGQPMNRGNSTNSRVPSSLSVRPRRSTDMRTESSAPGTPVQARAPFTRTDSKDTVTQISRVAIGQQPAVKDTARPSWESTEDFKVTEPVHDTSSIQAPSSPTGSSGSSAGSSDAGVTQSRAFTHRPQFSSPKARDKGRLPLLSSADEEEDEEDDSPAFLPLARPERASKPGREVATDRPSRFKQPSMALPPSQGDKETSASSSQSLPSPARPSSSIPSLSSQGVHAPRATAAAALSPKQRRIAQDGSEGSPSMGSSFSDLDDASVTQSALEEALAREISAGKGSIGVVGRMGGLWKGQRSAPNRSNRDG